MQHHLTRPSLPEILVRQGMLSKRVLDQVLGRLGGSTAALGQTLLEDGTISDQQLAQAVASQYGLAYDPLTGFRVDQEFYTSISVKLMRRHPFVPLNECDGVLTIAIPDPGNIHQAVAAHISYHYGLCAVIKNNSSAFFNILRLLYQRIIIIPKFSF